VPISTDKRKEISVDYSPLQNERFNYSPNLPPVLQEDLGKIELALGDPTESIGDTEDLRLLFAKTYGKPVARFKAGKGKNKSHSLTVGLILSGGQAPGGHNVIAGLFDGLKKGNPDSTLLGFRGGPSGILKDDVLKITKDIIDEYRNTGGFDMIGSGRTKLETEEQFQNATKVLSRRGVDALVVIGGDDSNTNAALLAEYFVKEGLPIQVIGVPKTIDGDLKNEYIETSFGFDTATKTYAELIGNIERDANSAKKYWHFIKLMGRSASHIALECALQTHPNVTLISEEIAEEKQSLDDIIECIVNVIVKRSEKDENFGVALVPEGLIEFIPEMKSLIGELNDLLAHHTAHFTTLNTYEDQSEWVNKNLSRDSSYVFSSLPTDIQRQLLMDRDPHGNVQVSRIETEKLLIEMTSDRLKEMKNEGRFTGKFSSQSHFFGYEGRCAFPSNFDADYCYSLGFTAFLLIAEGLTGYISAVRNLASGRDKWEAGGIPLVMMMNMEQRHGFKKPVIRKAMVETKRKPFLTFKEHRERWALETTYRYPGAVQYYGPPEICDDPTITLKLEQS
jgi:diphosphate-dependent phosphofructokinase